MRTLKNDTLYTAGQRALSTMAGWTPSHRSLETEAAELADVQEHDTAARVAFARQVEGVRHG